MSEARDGHTPVLTTEVLEHLDVRAGETVFDLTVGFGGHARLFAERVGRNGSLIGTDVDPTALETAERALAEAGCRVLLRRGNFADAPAALDALGLPAVDVLFADLGVNSAQIEDASRGLSFMDDGPLDMRLDPTLKTTAADLINRLGERELSDIFYFNAGEMGSRKIARAICNERRESRIMTTQRLVAVIARALHVDPLSRRSKIHPATRTFMALRMAVNDETGALAALLDAAPRMLRPGGRIGVIAFHSVEDRAVKQDFQRRKNEGIYELVTKKPVIAGAAERDANPRSRSAKLRVARRLEQA